MTPAERTAKIAELRAGADRLEREGERNWPEKVEAGMLFRHTEGATYIFPARDCDDLLCVVGDGTDEPGDYYSRDLFRSEPQHFAYLGHARDLLTIKAPDAPEPTGAELVGKVCEFSDDGKAWFPDSDRERRTCKEILNGYYIDSKGGRLGIRPPRKGPTVSAKMALEEIEALAKANCGDVPAGRVPRLLEIAQEMRAEREALVALVQVALMEGVAIATHRDDLTIPWDNGRRAWEGSESFRILSTNHRHQKVST